MARLNSVADPLSIEGAGDSGKESVEEAAGPVKIQRSLTRERLVKVIDVRREKEWASRDERRERMCRRESVAKVSS
jgi:hypothetical protein